MDTGALLISPDVVEGWNVRHVPMDEYYAEGHARAL